jgi:molecular chaperone DnaK (HSP70)
MARYVVGIDLGTTNTVVASAPTETKKAKKGGGLPVPQIFDIPQLVALREIEAHALLPSCLYAPLPNEVDGAGGSGGAGGGPGEWIVGELARRRGAETVGRFVSSAKSWLSHAAVDRTEAILPWGMGADEAAPKISPVDAAVRVLEKIRQEWDRAHPDAPLAEQEVVLTLPASFDEVARELTLSAATSAGLAPMLLEEPTAAFYDAMRDARSIEELLGGEEQKSVLVVDVGGGTTDLSLVAIARSDAPPGFEVRRVAVGRHILLGGDNMDLALAHLAEPRIASAHARLEPGELAQLVLSCRDAKERILAREADEARVVVLGRGSKLVGGARATTLDRAEVEGVVLGGFFPSAVEAGPAQRAPRAGIVSFGLPYERDPAITRHIRAFLARHAAEIPRGAPDAVLLNGGVFRAAPIVSALVDAIATWAGGAPPVVLPNTDPDLAVARGAVLYGFARRGVGMRVQAGAAHGYYAALAPEREGGQLRAVCILPRGAPEGERQEAKGRTFDLVVGRSVRFEIWASDVARHHAGDLVPIEEDMFERLPPIVARLPASGKEASVAVVLGGELLSTGQLELACFEKDGDRRFRLEFQLREASRGPSLAPPASILPSVRVPTAPSKIAEADKVAEHVFGKRADATPREVKDVVRDLEKVLGDRMTWTMEATRALADRLLGNPGARRRSPAHERAFWQLLGFCLRPGFGDPGDAARIDRVWPLFEGRLGFPDEPRGWPQFFIAWRRMAGGLDEARQVAMRDAMDPVVAPPEAGLKKPKRVPEGPDELLATLASLERVPIARRVQLGEWVLEKTWVDDDPRLWAAIGRLGARVPLYASAHHVVPAKNAEAWTERLLRVDWKKVATAPHAAVQLARVTGDRARDVSERVREEVSKRLESVGAKDEWVRSVRELVEIGEAERVAILGEGLPIGLRLGG